MDGDTGWYGGVPETEQALTEHALTEQQMVRQFLEMCTGAQPDTPTVPSVLTAALWTKLIAEELGELQEAFLKRDIVAIADALADLDYVVKGTAVVCGIDLAPIFAEVHRSNMTKQGGGQRADGKIQKGPHYTPPDLLPLLRTQGWEGE